MKALSCTDQNCLQAILFSHPMTQVVLACILSVKRKTQWLIFSPCALCWLNYGSSKMWVVTPAVSEKEDSVLENVFPGLQGCVLAHHSGISNDRHQGPFFFPVLGWFDDTVSPMVCFMPRNGSRNFKRGPGEGGEPGEFCQRTAFKHRGSTARSRSCSGERQRQHTLCF